MIKEYEFFHGAALTRLIHACDDIQISKVTKLNNASYVLNNSVGLYIKHSTNRLSPWIFTFRKQHQDEVAEMKKNYNNVFVVFVCNDDGIACLSHDELKLILDDSHDPVEWVKASRRIREKYTVTGSNGRLKTKIGDNEYPTKIVSSLRK